MPGNVWKYGLRLGVVAAAMFGIVATASADKPQEVTGIPFLDNTYKSVKPPKNHPLSEIISGYAFRTKETRELQDDDFLNPAMLWLEQGEAEWNTVEGDAGKSCASCHGKASKMKGVATGYPKFDKKLGKPVNLEQRINMCRTENMKAKELKFDEDKMIGLNILVRYQSRGMPVKVKVDGPMKPFFEKGKEHYYTRRGQLDMSCASCHEQSMGRYLRADFLSQGQINGFPTYRLKSQRPLSVHKRFEGCNSDVRAASYPIGSDEYVNLELYVTWRGQGLPIETPSVRH